MARFNLNDLEKFNSYNRRRWHKELIKRNGRNTAIRTIKKQIPEGYTLLDYMNELEAEIAKESK